MAKRKPVQLDLVVARAGGDPDSQGSALLATYPRAHLVLLHGYTPGEFDGGDAVRPAGDVTQFYAVCRYPKAAKELFRGPFRFLQAQLRGGVVIWNLGGSKTAQQAKSIGRSLLNYLDGK